jgi:glycosyltransferase involved in cell wall biosynthesis
MPAPIHAHKLSIFQIFNQYLEPGGEEEWVNQMLRLGDGNFSIEDLRFYSRAWVGRGAPSRWSQAGMLWKNANACAALRKRVETARPDALLFHNLIPVASLGMYEEAAKLGLPVLQYVHNFRPFSPSGTLWLRDRVNAKALQGNPWSEVFSRSWEKSFIKTFILAVQQKRLLAGDTLNVVKRWIAVSDFMRDRFIEAGIPAERVTTLRHCWHAKKELKPTGEGRHYLFLGRIVAEKGIRVLFDAWRILERRLGASCPSLIIAGIGPLEAQAHAWANRLDRVTCVGFVTGKVKDDLLMSCRALIAPSVWWEPLGLIVHEAYDSARPVLAARSGGLTETVINGKTGYLHEPGNAEQLADDVERLEAQGVSGRSEMGIAGREWLLKNASPAEWRERFVAIIREAVQG